VEEAAAAAMAALSSCLQTTIYSRHNRTVSTVNEDGADPHKMNG
jgi:hypothetical protein